VGEASRANLTEAGFAAARRISIGRFQMSVRGIMKNAVVLVVGILAAVALALAARGDVTIYNETLLPDGQSLKAGKYVVVIDEATKEVQFQQGREMVAKHSSRCVPLEQKNRYTEARFTEEAGKPSRLNEVRLQGMRCTHILE
jgi:hypothetical protein